MHIFPCHARFQLLPAAMPLPRRPQPHHQQQGQGQPQQAFHGQITRRSGPGWAACLHARGWGGLWRRSSWLKGRRKQAFWVLASRAEAGPCPPSCESSISGRPTVPETQIRSEAGCDAELWLWSGARGSRWATELDCNPLSRLQFRGQHRGHAAFADIERAPGNAGRRSGAQHGDIHGNGHRITRNAPADSAQAR